MSNHLPITIHDLTNDRAKNTRMLLSVPGLSETITPQLGNIIFVPGLAEDAGKEYRTLVIDIDGKDQIFYKPAHAATRASLSVYPGEAFDYEGAEFLFRHVGGIPLPYKAAALSIAVHRKDIGFLEVAFTPEERKVMELEYHAYVQELLVQEATVWSSGEDLVS